MVPSSQYLSSEFVIHIVLNCSWMEGGGGQDKVYSAGNRGNILQMQEGTLVTWCPLESSMVRGGSKNLMSQREIGRRHLGPWNSR